VLLGWPREALVAVPIFVGALAVDLVSKQWVVSNDGRLIFNDRSSELPLRVAMSLLAIGVALVLARLALMRGLGRQWGVWVGCGLLVAGTLANGVSALLWRQGVPDFISVGGGWMWNVADFEIAIGMTGGILSVGVSAIMLYVREVVAS
jgi:lipoprotein signal peptidase